MYKISVRDAKQQLRTQYKLRRSRLEKSFRQQCSQKITATILQSKWYQESRQIFIYVSMKDEVDTHSLIDRALADGKQVAVPYCIAESGEMNFYIIHSRKDLHEGYFGVYEPSPEMCERAENKQGLIIIPALAFDCHGYRMGYGKGYYDRYLSDFDGMKIGIGYSDCLRRCMIHDRFDKNVDGIITEKFIKFVAK